MGSSSFLFFHQTSKGLIVINARSRLLIALLGFLIIILWPVGYQLLDKNNNANKEEDEIIERAKATAIKHLKNKYELDVEITKTEMLPSYVSQSVVLEGNVMESKEQYFTMSVNYEKNEVFYFGMSPELVAAIRAKGHEPFIKK